MAISAELASVLDEVEVNGRYFFDKGIHEYAIKYNNFYNLLSSIGSIIDGTGLLKYIYSIDKAPKTRGGARTQRGINFYGDGVNGAKHKFNITGQDQGIYDFSMRDLVMAEELSLPVIQTGQVNLAKKLDNNGKAMSDDWSIDLFAEIFRGTHIVDVYNGHDAPRTKEIRPNYFSGVRIPAAAVSQANTSLDNLSLPSCFIDNSGKPIKFSASNCLTFDIKPATVLGQSTGIYMNIRALIQNVTQQGRYVNPVIFCSNAVKNNIAIDANYKMPEQLSKQEILQGFFGTIDGVQMQVLPSLGAANEFGVDYSKIHILIIDMDPSNILMPVWPVRPLQMAGEIADEIVQIYRIKGATMWSLAVLNETKVCAYAIGDGTNASQYRQYITSKGQVVYGNFQNNGSDLSNDFYTGDKIDDPFFLDYQRKINAPIDRIFNGTIAGIETVKAGTAGTAVALVTNGDAVDGVALLGGNLLELPIGTYNLYFNNSLVNKLPSTSAAAGTLIIAQGSETTKNLSVNITNALPTNATAFVATIKANDASPLLGTFTLISQRNIS